MSTDISTIVVFMPLSFACFGSYLLRFEPTALRSRMPHDVHLIHCHHEWSVYTASPSQLKMSMSVLLLHCVLCNLTNEYSQIQCAQIERFIIPFGLHWRVVGSLTLFLFWVVFWVTGTLALTRISRLWKHCTVWPFSQKWATFCPNQTVTLYLQIRQSVSSPFGGSVTRFSDLLPFGLLSRLNS